MVSNKHTFYVSYPYIAELSCKKSRRPYGVFEKNWLLLTTNPTLLYPLLEPIFIQKIKGGPEKHHFRAELHFPENALFAKMRPLLASNCMQKIKINP